ncbi:MAG: hypothetical protein OQL28_08755 [Sedimenticola sp.]|nr:hypothetical protein [Sedimenticola sp.]
MNCRRNHVLQGVILLAGVATLVMPLFAATYQCEKDGVIIYSDTRCGPEAKQSEEVRNSYPGKLRPGEQQMLNETRTRSNSGSSGADTSPGYGERLKEQNERRKAEGDKRRIPRESNSPWH